MGGNRLSDMIRGGMGAYFSRVKAAVSTRTIHWESSAQLQLTIYETIEVTVILDILKTVS